MAVTATETPAVQTALARHGEPNPACQIEQHWLFARSAHRRVCPDTHEVSVSDIIHTRTNAAGEEVTFTDEQMQLVHVWMAAARKEGASKNGESYSRQEVEEVCSELVGEVLAAIDRLCKSLPPSTGIAVRDGISADLEARGIIEPVRSARVNSED